MALTLGRAVESKWMDLLFEEEIFEEKIWWRGEVERVKEIRRE